MKYRIRLPYLVWSLLLSLGSATPLLAQQDQLQPLLSDPGRGHQVRATAAQRGTATTVTLTLPFFEDFAGQPEGRPSPARWKEGQVLVNERFSQAPPSRGMATFDGLDSLGRPSYGPINSYGPTDTLTSQAIDLSGLSTTSSVYLSYFWQAGTIVRAPSGQLPSRRVGLQLEFLDNTGKWVVKWNRPSTGQRTRFQQQFIAVDSARYLHAGFRFRFTSYGSRAGTTDAWNLDYIVLNRNRNITNVSYADVVLSAPLSSLLKRYSAMPVWQYNAAPNPTDELNDSTFTTFNNLDTLVAPTPFSWRGVVRTLPSGAERQFTNGNTILDAGTKQYRISGSVRTTPLTINAAPTRVQHSINLNLLTAGDPRTAPNDTVRRITEFSNYFAYDDGTSEGTYILQQGTSGSTSRALRFDLNRPDQVSALRVYYAGTTATTGTVIPATVTLTFAVWERGADGLPAATPKAVKSVALPTSTDSAGFRTIRFDQVVPVSGAFFIGYTQPATNLFINFGVDLNSRQPAHAFYDRNVASPWVEFSNRTVVPMLRPVMTGLITSAHSPAADAALSIYPNPSPGLVQVAGRYTRAVALDALGRVAWQQSAADAGKAQFDLRGLPAGVYLLRLTLPNGLVSTQRLVLQPE